MYDLLGKKLKVKEQEKEYREKIKQLKEQLKNKEQECQQAMDNYVQLDLQRVKEYNKLVDLYKAKERECEELKKERDTLSITREKLLDDLFVVEENLKDYIEHFNKVSDELDQLKAENNKLKTTLTEIKEICNEYQKEYILNIGVEILTNNILQIIERG